MTTNENSDAVLPRPRLPPWSQRLLGIAFWAILLIGLAATWAWFRRGSMNAAMSDIRGQVLIVEAVKDEVVAAPGEVVETQIKVRNLMDQPLTILGCRLTCTCMKPKNLPLVLEANEESQVVLEYAAADSASFLKVGVQFYLDQPSVAVRTTVPVRTDSGQQSDDDSG